MNLRKHAAISLPTNCVLIHDAQIKKPAIPKTCVANAKHGEIHVFGYCLLVWGGIYTTLGQSDESGSTDPILAN